MLTGLVSAWSQSRSDFSKVSFDGTFVYLNQHILDPSDLAVLLQWTNANFQNLSKTNGKDLSWDSDGVRYTEQGKNLKVTWVLDSGFLHFMHGHPTHVFEGKITIFGIEVARNKAIPEALLSKYGFEATGNAIPRYYQLEKNGWELNLVTNRDRDPEAVTLEHSLNPD